MVWKTACALVLAGVSVWTLAGCASQASSQKWSSEQVLQAFIDSGLEVANPEELTEYDFDMMGVVAKQGTGFLIPSLCVVRRPIFDQVVGCGGIILAFDSSDELGKMQAYFAKLVNEGAGLAPRVIVKDNILVLVSGELREERAHEYKEALESMR